MSKYLLSIWSVFLFYAISWWNFRILAPSTNISVNVAIVTAP